MIEKKEKGFVTLSKPIIEEMSAKMIMVIAYLRIYMSISGELSLTVEYLVRRLGFKPDSHSGKINEKILNILEDLKRAGAIEYDLDEKKYTECFKIVVDTKHVYFSATDNFVVLHEDEYEKIANAGKGYRSDVLTAVLLQIKKRITQVKGFNGGGDKAENYCFASVATITADVNKMEDMQACEETVRKYIKKLVSLEIIAVHRTGQYEYNGQLRAMTNFYNEGQHINNNACDAFAKNYLKKTKGIVVENFIPLKNKNIEMIRDTMDDLFDEEII